MGVIDLSDIRKFFASIADAIIDNIEGNNTYIPYFEYCGKFESRNSVPKGRKGIYIFTVEEHISLTAEMIRKYNGALNWDNKKVGAGFNRGDLSEINPGDVFYLGSVRGEHNSVFQRLKTHFGDRTDSATNGIKMKMKERDFVDGKLVVHVFLFEKNNTDYYVISEVEKILHKKLKPITGGSQ